MSFFYAWENCSSDFVGCGLVLYQHFVCMHVPALFPHTQGIFSESARLSEGLFVKSGGKEHHFSMFMKRWETLELMEQLAKIATKE